MLQVLPLETIRELTVSYLPNKWQKILRSLYTHDLQLIKIRRQGMLVIYLHSRARDLALVSPFNKDPQINPNMSLLSELDQYLQLILLDDTQVVFFKRNLLLPVSPRANSICSIHSTNQKLLRASNQVNPQTSSYTNQLGLIQHLPINPLTIGRPQCDQSRP